ncbi:MAG TPA: amidohydrolase family protein [Gemmatimonas sp.]|nr:amidohydrolase family protein [Gemmatimonas sp.]
MIAYQARWVLPMCPSQPAIIEHGVVVVDGAHIAFVGRADDADRPATDPDAPNVEHVQLGNSVLMPGLVNAHSHLELTAMRGMLEGLAFRDWLATLTAARRDLFDAGTLLDAARHGLREALRNGITTCADTSDSGAPLQAMREAGTRGVGYVETFGPDPASCADAIKTLRERAAAYREHDTALVRVGISPHAPYTVSGALFGAVAALAHDEGYPVAVHIAESAAETQFVRDGAGPFAEGLRARGIAVQASARSPVALLHSTGLLAARPLLIHAIHADDADLALIAGHGATVVHCPISNAKLGQGIARLQPMLDAGIAVGLGTDSVASNDRMDLLGEARQATLLAALQARVPDALPAMRALELATIGGARALGLFDRIGSIEAGKEADLVAFPMSSPDVTAVHDPAVTLVHVLAGTVRASLVLVAGRELVRAGELLAADDGLDVRVAAKGVQLQEWMRARRVALPITRHVHFG